MSRIYTALLWNVSTEDILLVKKFNEALHDASVVTRDPYLAKLGSALAAVEAAIPAISELKSYEKALDNLIGTSGFGLNGNLTEIFAQTLGEAQFLVMCHENGIALRRIPEEKNKKTPDFRAIFDACEMFFEVKTLSVVNGAFGITDGQKSSLDANIDIESQLKRGARIAIGISEAQHYANKVEWDKTILGVANTLLEKTRGNIKADQFASPNTFLVLNLSVIPPLVTSPRHFAQPIQTNSCFPKLSQASCGWSRLGTKACWFLALLSSKGSLVSKVFLRRSAF